MKNKLKDIRGERIRWQIFTPIIYMIYMAFAMGITMIGIFTLLGKEGTKFESSTEFFETVLLFVIFEVPFVLLSLINRRFAGKTVCVLCKDGIYYDDGIFPDASFMPWSDIKSARYEAQFPSRSFSPVRNNLYIGCHMEIRSKYKNEKAIVYHAPHFLVYKMKKYCPTIDVKFSGFSKFMIIGTVLFPIVAPALILVLV